MQRLDKWALGDVLMNDATRNRLAGLATGMCYQLVVVLLQVRFVLHGLG